MAALEAMGFPAAASRLSLRRARGDVSRAVEWLLNNAAGDGEGDAASEASSPTLGHEEAADADLGPAGKRARAAVEVSPLQRRLTEMGFPSEAAQHTLKSSGGNLERAVMKLLESGPGQWPSVTPRSQGDGKGAAESSNAIAGVSSTEAESSLASFGASAGSGSSSLAAPSQPSTAAQSNVSRLLTTELMASTLVFGSAAFGPLHRSKASAPARVDGKGAEKLHSDVPQILKASVPGVTEMRGERGNKTVTQMLGDCLKHGLHMHGKPSSPVNSQIIPAIQHIFRELSALPAKDPKRVSRLSALAEACQDCQQVQAREILRIYGEMTAQSETFEGQLKYSLVQQKEAALHRYITQKHQKCDQDHTRVKPWQQREHLLSAYVDMIGEEFGLDGVVAARSDRFLPQAREEVGRVQKQRLVETLKKDMSIKEWLQTLLADINNQSSSADRLVNRDCIFKWAQANMSSEAAHRVFYDEERAAEFEDHDPKEPTAENRFQPFLSCNVLVEMLVSSGMLFRDADGRGHSKRW